MKYSPWGHKEADTEYCHFHFQRLRHCQTQSKHFCPKQHDEKYYWFCAQVQHEGLGPPSSSRASTLLQTALTVTTSLTLP